jgi:hypothetical protein
MNSPSYNCRQLWIVSSSTNRSLATASQLNPSSSKTRAFARRRTDAQPIRPAPKRSGQSGLPVVKSRHARQRDQLFAILFAKEAASSHKPIGIRQTKKCKEFLPVLQ